MTLGKNALPSKDLRSPTLNPLENQAIKTCKLCNHCITGNTCIHSKHEKLSALKEALKRLIRNISPKLSSCHILSRFKEGSFHHLGLLFCCIKQDSRNLKKNEKKSNAAFFQRPVKHCIHSKQGLYRIQSKRWPSLLAMCCFLSTVFLFSSCGIYNGGFQRGGELTSDFLERIQENSKDEEDTLLPPQQEKTK